MLCSNGTPCYWAPTTNDRTTDHRLGRPAGYYSEAPNHQQTLPVSLHPLFCSNKNVPQTHNSKRSFLWYVSGWFGSVLFESRHILETRTTHETQPNWVMNLTLRVFFFFSLKTMFRKSASQGEGEVVFLSVWAKPINPTFNELVCSKLEWNRLHLPLPPYFSRKRGQYGR